MKRLNVGIDVSKDDFKAAIKDTKNKTVMPARTYKQNRPGMDAFQKEVDKLSEEYDCDVIYGMESTGIYHLPLYQYLLDAGKDVKLFNGLEMKRFKEGKIRKTETDKIDAGNIAEALILEWDSHQDINDEPMLIRIRELERLHDRLTKKSSKCKSQAIRVMDILCRGYTDLFNDIFSTSSIEIIRHTIRKTRLFETDAETMTEILREYMSDSKAKRKAKKLDNLFQNTVVPEFMIEPCILEIHMLIHQFQTINEQIERVERKIEKLVKAYDPYMLSVPGIGPLTAGIILGELRDPSRFSSRKEVTAFAGLDPSVKESGKMRKTGKISKRGPPNLRKALYNAVLPALQFNPVCKEFYDRLDKKGKHHNVVRIAVARKLLLIAWSVEKNQKEFYVPSYVSEEYISKEN